MSEHMKSIHASRSSAAIAAAVMTSFLFAGCAHAPAADPAQQLVRPAPTSVPGAVATVNGVAIMRTEVDDLLRTSAQPDSLAQRETIVRGLIARELIRQAAESEKLGDASEVRAAEGKARVDIENRLYVSRHLQPTVVTDEEVRQRYDAVVASLGPVSYKPRVIVLPDEQAAQRALARLARHESFDKVAATASVAPNKAEGGALQWMSLKTPVTDGQTQGLPIEVARALVKLRPGQYTRTAVPVGSNRVLVKLDATRPTTVPPYAQVQDSLRKSMQAKRQDDAFGALVDSLAQKAVITRQ
ncbi:peptidylprolyl isomerase [Burkholderia latens]|nr:peptidylprolyl isomerase [Burkholderia latens]VWB17084.1 peptidyl-prolyl cis-trans isomerase [Burkholderia latens]